MTEERREQIVELVFDCVEKACNDYLAEKQIDYEALHAIYESVRIMNHLVRMDLPFVNTTGNTDLGAK